VTSTGRGMVFARCALAIFRLAISVVHGGPKQLLPTASSAPVCSRCRSRRATGGARETETDSAARHRRIWKVVHCEAGQNDFQGELAGARLPQTAGCAGWASACIARSQVTLTAWLASWFFALREA
jgi:hypothetical protein